MIVSSILQTNDTFKAEEYISKEIIKTQNNIQSLEANQQAFLKRSAQFKDIINDLKRLSNEKIYNDAANINLSLINQTSVQDAKIRLTDFYNRISDVRDSKNQQLGQIQSKINEIIINS